MKSVTLRRIKSFAIFDLPVNYHYVYINFQTIHERYRNTHAIWPATATRLKLIVDYWNNALLHYLLIVTAGTLLTTPFFSIDSLNDLYFFTICIAGALSYVPLYFIVYRHMYNSEFLPKLETAVAEYEGKERAWQEKCKQDQLSNRTLVFLFYVLDKASNLNRLTATDKWADQLHKIYGVSPKGMKNELDLVFKEEKKQTGTAPPLRNS